MPEPLERLAALPEEVLEVLAEAAERGLLTDYEPDDGLWLEIATGNLDAVAAYAREAQSRWMENFARGLAKSRNLIDQREVDEKRGYWYGALYFTNVLPRIAQRKVAKKAARKDEHASS